MGGLGVLLTSSKLEYWGPTQVQIFIPTYAGQFSDSENRDYLNHFMGLLWVLNKRT